MTDRGPPGVGARHGLSPTVLPTVAVAPFLCIRHGTVSAEFGAGLALAVTSALMRVPGVNVLTPATSLGRRSRRRTLMARSAAGIARYLVTGSVVQNDQVLTVEVRLQDGLRLAVLYRRPLDLHLSHLHDLQRNIVSRLLAEILPELRQAEIDRALSKAPADVSSYEKLLVAIVRINNQTLEDHLHAERLLAEIREADPDFADAFAWSARLYSVRVGQGWTKDRLATSLQALEFADHAVWLDPRNALALATAGHLNSYLLKRYDVGLGLLERAIEACPNEPLAWLFYGMSLAYTGRVDEGRRAGEYGHSLSPNDPFAYMFHSLIGVICYLAGDFKAAVRRCRLSADDNPNYVSTFTTLAASLVALGDVTGARRVSLRILELEPSFAAIAADRLPFADPGVRALMVRRLRTAGALPPPARP